MAIIVGLDGKVAIITGGASGIGEAAVHHFWRNGAKVIIADIEDDLGRAICDQLDESAIYVHCDVSKEEDISNLVDTVITKYGKLDIMYNNAGIIEGFVGSIINAKKSDLDKIIGVNLVGGFLGAKHAARVMVPAREGSILFTASACATIAGLGSHAYTASKCALVGLMTNLAAELGQYGIRVNCVSPYAVTTTSIAKKYGEANAMKAEALVQSVANLKETGMTVDDVANAAVYLASDEASYVSGLNLVVDGGFSVVNPTLMMAQTQGRQWVQPQ
ncbi:hypothetical protein IFM89_038337 [Coptis chinensis]|uniref:Secoisolariciresinol dehydrogenase n=1 Tax=Coptis chinensis TaxID=261450 RepID=A0A835I7S3_9MAGN|nr:hypothetical protein IFM89_038337 [Coptis chinensis]